MNIRWVFAAAGGIAAVLVVATPVVAEATLSISVPPSANLGSASTTASSLSGSLGTVTVGNSGPVGTTFTATVTCTNFTTGAGGLNEVIVKASISYWSGPATSTKGVALAVPGQVTAAQAQTLAAPRTAFSGTGVSPSLAVSWRPTIVVSVPNPAIAGVYSGTITHSVA